MFSINLCTLTMQRSTTAHILMAEDDQGRVRAFSRQALARGDMTLIATRVVSEVMPLLSKMRAEGGRVDLVVLDIRLPKDMDELNTSRADEYPPLGVDVAEALADDPDTASIPVYLYTQYVSHPAVIKRVEALRARHPANLVTVFPGRPTFSEILAAGLPHRQQVRVSAQRAVDDTSTIILHFDEAALAVDLSSVTLLLNGMAPVRREESPGTRDIRAAFAEEAWFPHDVNFLSVTAPSGQKSIVVIH